MMAKELKMDNDVAILVYKWVASLVRLIHSICSLCCNPRIQVGCQQIPTVSNPISRKLQSSYTSGLPAVIFEENDYENTCCNPRIQVGCQLPAQNFATSAEQVAILVYKWVARGVT